MELVSEAIAFAVKAPERLSDTPAWLEYKTLTELVFGKEN